MAPSTNGAGSGPQVPARHSSDYFEIVAPISPIPTPASAAYPRNGGMRRLSTSLPSAVADHIAEEWASTGRGPTAILSEGLRAYIRDGGVPLVAPLPRLHRPRRVVAWVSPEDHRALLMLGVPGRRGMGVAAVARALFERWS